MSTVVKEIIAHIKRNMVYSRLKKKGIVCFRSPACHEVNDKMDKIIAGARRRAIF